MRKLFTALIVLSLLFTLSNCDSGDDNGGNGGNNNPSPPTISSLSPSSKAANMPAFTLTASGTGFTANSKIVFNNVEKQTTFVSSTSLTCQINNADIQLTSALYTEDLDPINIQNRSISVLVRNPSSEGGDSTASTFTVLSNPEFNQFQTVPEGDEPLHCLVDTSNYIYLVFQDWVSKDNRYDIFFSKSINYGQSWSKKLNITAASWSHGNTYSYNPFIARDKTGKTYVIWNEGMGGTKVVFRSSADNGTSWSAKSTIAESTNNEPINQDVKSSFIIDSNGHLYVFWTTYNFSTYKDYVYYSISNDKGSSWSTPVKIPGLSGLFHMIKASISNDGILYILIEDWANDDYKVLFIKSENYCSSWSQASRLNTPGMGSSARKPSIAVDSEGNIHSVMVADKNIWYRKSSDNGVSWSTSLNLSKSTNDSNFPEIVVDSMDNISLVWYENHNIFYCRTTDKGTNWTTPANLTNFSDGSAGEPYITNDNNCNTLIFWGGYPPPSKTVGLFYNFSKK